MTLHYAGPALLEKMVNRYYPNQPTIFHRVNKISLKVMHPDKIGQLTQFRELKEVEFYNYKELDSVTLMQNLFPEWDMEVIRQGGPQYRLVQRR